MNNLKKKLEETGNLTKIKAFGEAYQSEFVGLLRGENDSTAMLDFQFKNGKSRTLCYVDLREMEFDASEGLQLYFSSLRVGLLCVALTGRNLNLVHDMLKLQRVHFLKENPSDADEFGDDDIVIDEIEFKEVSD